jgi:hypothetical protein
MGAPPNSPKMKVLAMRPAALASGKPTRDGTGGQLTFQEVIMSRLHSVAS